MRLSIYHKDHRKSLSEPKNVVLGTFCRSYSYELLEIQLIIMKKFGRIKKNYYLCGNNSLNQNLDMKTKNYSVSADTASTLNVIGELIEHYGNLCTLFEDGEPTQELQDAYDRLLQVEKNLLANGILNKIYQQDTGNFGIEI